MPHTPRVGMRLPEQGRCSRPDSIKKEVSTCLVKKKTKQRDRSKFGKQGVNKQA
jgi:hypothetical protein